MATRELTLHDRMLSALLDIGEGMLLSGADVSLVEARLRDMGRACGAQADNVFALSSLIVASYTLPDGTVLSENRRVSRTATTDFDKLKQLYDLSEDFIKHPLSAEELEYRFSHIEKRPFPRVMLYGGSILSTACFAVFFGGSLIDAVVAAVFSVVVCWMMEYVKPHVTNNNVFSFLAAFVSGVGIVLLARLLALVGLHINIAMTIVGVIMILIPGVALTNAARDMISGDVITGVVDFIEVMISATALAFGYIAALWLLSAGMVGTPTTIQPHIALQLAMALLSSLGFAVVFNMHKHAIFATALGGLLTWIVYSCATGLFPENAFLATCMAAVFAGVYSAVLGVIFKAPASMYFYIVSITLIPGRLLYFTMACAASGNWEMFASFGIKTLMIVLGLAVGMSLVWALGALFQRRTAQIVQG